MNRSTMMTSAMPRAPVGKAWEEVSASFDRFCLAAGIETLGAMMEADAEAACGPRHSRSAGPARSSLGAHGGQDRFPRWQGGDRATSGARAPAARNIHAYWLARRALQEKRRQTVHKAPAPGRNDPCPCGSGKKFKHCHAVPGTLH